MGATQGILISLAAARARTGQPIEGLNYLAVEARVVEAALYRVRGELFNAAGNRTRQNRVIIKRSRL
jgi:uncharacterized membrane protein affecting hemolysin expression